MSFSIRNMLLMPLRIRCSTNWPMLQRGTSKIAVDMDSQLSEQLNNNELKPRQHPGIVKSNNIELPQHITKALQRVVGDYPVKTLLRDCQRLNQYIAARHPPAEQQEIRERMQSIMSELNQRFPMPAQFDSEESEIKFMRKRESLLTKRLAQRTYAWKAITYGAYEAIVYALARAAHEYAVLMHILQELKLRDAAFKPRSYFDFGSGVGTGLWAVSSLWSEHIFEYFNVDSSRDMHDLAELILRGGNDNQQHDMKNIYYRQFLPGIETKYDLIVCSHSLFELPSMQNRQEVLLNLWRKCDGYLIIVEEGTRRGFELINEAREFLLQTAQTDASLQAHVVAPCPHDNACPRFANLIDRTPCNFELHYTPLGVGKNSQERSCARFSYVVMKKGPITDATQNWPRLVRPTLLRSKHAICRMCTADGRLQEVIFTKAKHGKNAYRCAKVSRWGDRLPIEVGQPFEMKNDELNILEEVDVEQSEAVVNEQVNESTKLN